MSVLSSNDASFPQMLMDHPKVVVKYYADWCGSCKLFNPKFKRLALADTNEGILFLDINAEENNESRKIAGVDNLPFFASFHNGKLVEATATSKEEVVSSMISNLKTL